MALFKELLVADLSGKVGANVFSHNAGGKYVRVLSIPTNPNTVPQQAVRNAFANLTDQWFNTLSIGQRSDWNRYADAVSITNRIGEAVFISGLAMYVRCNTARLAVLGSRQPDGPTSFTNSTFLGQLAINATAVAQTIDFQFEENPALNPWVAEAGSFLMTYVSRPQNVSVLFFRGPYQFAGSQQGDPVVPSSPLTVTAPFTFVAGQKLFWRQFVTQLDGRISQSFFGVVIAVA